MTITSSPHDTDARPSSAFGDRFEDPEVLVDPVDHVEESSPEVEPAPRRMGIGRLVLAWVVVSFAVVFLVLYALEPLFQQNDQNRLMDEYVAEIDRAVNETTGLGGITVATKPPALGAPVGIVEIPGLRLQQVVVEGVGPDQTQLGPGHVPGTAALGQPGNSAVVGRRAMFGGSFDRLGELEQEDLILVTTTQGQVVYKVDAVERVQVIPSSDGSSDSQLSTPPTTSLPVPGTGGDVVSETGPRLTSADELYRPTDDDQLTLVTSASAMPTNSELATVVTAKLQGTAYEPTPQAGRSDDQTGMTGGSGSLPALFLALQAFALSVAAAIVFYRRSSKAVAYLLTTPPLVVFAIIAAEQLGRMFPAWS